MFTPSGKSIGRRVRLTLVAATLVAVSAMGASPSSSPAQAVTPTGATAADPTDVSLNPGALPDRLASLGGSFAKHAGVFGVDIVATAATPDEAVTHAASVLAQYLDNDADGKPDDPAVINALVDNNALLFMGADQDELEEAGLYESGTLDGFAAQDLYASETNPREGFNAALEEVHHLIATQGWAKVYPDELSQEKGSRLAQAMDEARGGVFDQVPTSYPKGSWYHYDDRTCDYSCMATEYIYWAHTSLLGAQAERCDEIAVEWEPCTADALRRMDPSVTELLEDPKLGLPTTLPDGNYSAA